MTAPRVKRLHIPVRDRILYRPPFAQLQVYVSMYDFVGRHISIRAGTAGQSLGELIIESRNEVRINLGSAEAAIKAANFLAGLIRRVEGVDFTVVRSTVPSASHRPRHKAYRASWEPGWTYDADAPDHIPGRMLGDNRYERLSEDDLRANDWVIECSMVK